MIDILPLLLTIGGGVELRVWSVNIVEPPPAVKSNSNSNPNNAHSNNNPNIGIRNRMDAGSCVAVIGEWENIQDLSLTSDGKLAAVADGNDIKLLNAVEWL